MLYYVELDETKEFLEIHEVKNIHNLSKQLKVAWGYLDYYLSDNYSDPNGRSMPFIKKSIKKVGSINKKVLKIYLISHIKQWIEMKNTRFMSKNIMDELRTIATFGIIQPTVSLIREQMKNDGKVIPEDLSDYDNNIGKVSTDIIIESLEKRKVKPISEDIFDKEIVIDCKPTYKSRYSNAIEEEIEDIVKYYREHTDEIREYVSHRGRV